MDPDNPYWGVLAGIGTWGFNVAVSIIIPLIAVLIWLIPKIAQQTTPPDRQQLMLLVLSPTGLFIQVVAIAPVHLATLGFCWAIVTRMGKRPFFESLGWQWRLTPGILKVASVVNKVIAVLLVLAFSYAAIAIISRSVLGSDSPRPPLWVTAAVAAVAAIAVAFLLRFLNRLDQNPNRKAFEIVAKTSYIIGTLVAVIAAAAVLERVLPQKEETDFDMLLKAGSHVRIAVAIIAVASAPLIEEIVYRGVLYSAVRKRVGVGSSVAMVTLLFAGVHFPQYWGAWAGLAGLTFLSLILTVVRASTKSLLPCFLIHLLNNVVGAIQILLGAE
jgi:membrane protease YdiL (CAAX protease family)